MKKVLLIIFIILCSSKLYSAEPLVNFYLEDGSSKRYNLSEIDNMKFISAPATLQLHIFRKIGKSLYYPAQLIDSIKFAIDYANENRLHLWHDGFIWNVAIHEIDSILIYYTEFVAVTIGEQHWMYRNLNVDHYRNGDSIPENMDSEQWLNLATGARCYYDNDPAYEPTYGKLYNWYAVNDSGELAPVGWHIPSDMDWKILEMRIGMTQSQADSSGLRGTNESCKLRETGTSHWFSPNICATNESGFTGLPGGYRGGNASFGDIVVNGNWWSSTGVNVKSAWFRYLHKYNGRVIRDINNKAFGFSVRCIKDE